MANYRILQSSVKFDRDKPVAVKFDDGNELTIVPVKGKRSAPYSNYWKIDKQKGDFVIFKVLQNGKLCILLALLTCFCFRSNSSKFQCKG